MLRISDADIQNKVKNLKTLDDAHIFTKELVAPVIQEILETELEQYLGYPKYHQLGNKSGNSRNGYSKKTLKGRNGEVPLKIPRDRKGEFEPQIVRKYQTVDSVLEERVISMYAKGVSTRDIQVHLEDLYGIDVSPSMISAITDKVLPLGLAGPPPKRHLCGCLSGWHAS